MVEGRRGCGGGGGRCCGTGIALLGGMELVRMCSSEVCRCVPGCVSMEHVDDMVEGDEAYQQTCSKIYRPQRLRPTAHISRVYPHSGDLYRKERGLQQKSKSRAKTNPSWGIHSSRLFHREYCPLDSILREINGASIPISTGVGV